MATATVTDITDATEIRVCHALRNWGEMAESATSEAARAFWAHRRDGLVSTLLPAPKRKGTRKSK